MRLTDVCALILLGSVRMFHKDSQEAVNDKEFFLEDVEVEMKMDMNFVMFTNRVLVKI